MLGLWDRERSISGSVALFYWMNLLISWAWAPSSRALTLIGSGFFLPSFFILFLFWASAEWALDRSFSLTSKIDHNPKGLLTGGTFSIGTLAQEAVKYEMLWIMRNNSRHQMHIKCKKEDFSFLTAIYLDLLDYIFSPQSFNDFYWKTENWKSYDFDPINPFGL